MAKERKVVSVLFVDLVGFTAQSESADPEDVDALLRGYHRDVRHEIERYGGTVEKFIGDAVVAVFGAPVAHEDDPERAVRAALRILDATDLDIRIAVNTGEVLVDLDSRPEHGEGMVTGDAVNTASRLQGAAPVRGILVGDATHAATARAIEYEELEPVEVKGKSQPLQVWRALDARSRFGVDVDAPAAAPFVGRRRELELLQQLARALRGRVRDPTGDDCRRAGRRQDAAGRASFEAGWTSGPRSCSGGRVVACPTGRVSPTGRSARRSRRRRGYWSLTTWRRPRSKLDI